MFRRSLRSKKKTPLCDDCIRDHVSATKQFDGFTKCGTGVFTKTCRVSVNFMKIGSVTLIMF